MTDVTDTKVQEEMLRQRLEQHEQSLRDERKEDPERFQPSKQSSPSRSMSKIMRGPTRPVGQSKGHLNNCKTSSSTCQIATLLG